MFVIIEWNGIYQGIAFFLDEDGEVLKFRIAEDAYNFAEENCAFNYKVVEI